MPHSRRYHTSGNPILAGCSLYDLAAHDISLFKKKLCKSLFFCLPYKNIDANIAHGKSSQCFVCSRPQIQNLAWPSGPRKDPELVEWQSSAEEQGQSDSALDTLLTCVWILWPNKKTRWGKKSVYLWGDMVALQILFAGSWSYHVELMNV